MDIDGRALMVASTEEELASVRPWRSGTKGREAETVETGLGDQL